VNHYIDRLSTAGGDVGLENSCQIAGFRQRAQDAFGYKAARNSVWGCPRVNALVRTYPLPRDTVQTTYDRDPRHDGDHQDDSHL
jgi:hypothetical protein